MFLRNLAAFGVLSFVIKTAPPWIFMDILGTEMPCARLWCEPRQPEPRMLNRIMLQQKFYHDVIKWKHFPRYWPFVRGIHRWPVNSPHKGQWRGALVYSLIYAWPTGWVNNRDASDLRRHRAHYDISVMSNMFKFFNSSIGHENNVVGWSTPVLCKTITTLIRTIIYKKRNQGIYDATI